MTLLREGDRVSFPERRGGTAIRSVDRITGSPRKRKQDSQISILRAFTRKFFYEKHTETHFGMDVRQGRRERVERCRKRKGEEERSRKKKKILRDRNGGGGVKAPPSPPTSRKRELEWPSIPRRRVLAVAKPLFPEKRGPCLKKEDGDICSLD